MYAQHYFNDVFYKKNKIKAMHQVRMPGRSFSRYFGVLRSTDEHKKITMKEASKLWKLLSKEEQEQYPTLPRTKRKKKEEGGEKKKKRKRGVNGYILYNMENSSKIYHAFEKKIPAPTKPSSESEDAIKAWKKETTEWRRSIMRATSQTISSRWKAESDAVKNQYKKLAMERNLKAKEKEAEKEESND